MKTQTSLFATEKTVAGEKEKTEGFFEVLAVADIKKPALIEYLNTRSIDLSIAKSYLKQVCFKPKTSPKPYYGLGFACGDGFEVRNKAFKGFVGQHKTITCFNLANHNSLSIFEGFMDFLSFLSSYDIRAFTNSVLILNSISLKKQALQQISGFTFSKVYLFLDNDLPGKQTAEFFRQHLHCPVIDKSALYHDYKDFNQMTMENPT